MESEEKRVFHVTATRVDDRWCVWESDIRGLFLETDSWLEMKECIECITPMVLMENHKLKETDLANVVVHVKIKNDEVKPKKPSGTATFLFEREQELALM